MRQINIVFKNVFRLLGMLVVSGILSTQVQAGAQNSIIALNVSGASNGALLVKIDFAQPLVSIPAGFTINAPPRIAFDFPNTSNGLGKSLQSFTEGDLRSANIVQSGGRARLVLNLSQPLPYDAKIDGNSLLITLQQGKQAETAVSNAPAARFAEAKQDAQKHALRDVDFHRGKNGEGRIQIDLSDPGIGIDIREQTGKLIIDFMKTSLPGNLKRKLDVVDFATPVQSVDTFVEGDSVRMVIEPKGSWEHTAYQTDTKFVVEVKPVVEDPNKLVKGSQVGYLGEKLTLNFQKIEVREALNVIADFTELNIVIDDSVTGNLTLRLKDVPWDQALDIILNSKDLGKVKNGSVIQIAPRGKLALMVKESLTEIQDNDEIQELFTESFMLSYNTAEEVASLLSYGDKGAGGSATSTKSGNVEGSQDNKSFSASGSSTSTYGGYMRGGRLLSKRGSAVADKRTNTVFVQDTRKKIEQIREIIKKIDLPVKQVLIEARFVSAGDSFNLTLGGKLGYQGPAVAAGTGDTVIGNGVTSGMRGLLQPNVNLPGATSGTGGLTLSLFNPLATKVLTLELSASELDGRTKNIASPRVVTKDKYPATISAGVQIPYTVSSSLGSTTQFKDATLSLEVTPHITPDDHISLIVKANQDTVGAIYGGIPSINTKKVNTEVVVENGGTVVIGGVFTQDIANSTEKVPLLGDVPVIGWLFKTNVKSDNKSELLIFITPKIMKDEMNLR